MTLLETTRSSHMRERVKDKVSSLFMRRSNCSAPIPPGQPRGQRKYACDKKGGALENEGIKVINKGGVR